MNILKSFIKDRRISFLSKINVNVVSYYSFFKSVKYFSNNTNSNLKSDSNYERYYNKLNSFTEKISEKEKLENEKDKSALSFKNFGFMPKIYDTLDKLELFTPTSIQSLVIPKILSRNNNMFFCSNTGMGKTLCYLLPIINFLKLEENSAKGKLTVEFSPRVIILAPTRELVQQIEEVAKLFIYDNPLVVKSSFVGKKLSQEEKEIMNGVDILISTPDRISLHLERQKLKLDNVKYLIVDELDTILDSGKENIIRNFSEIMINLETDILINNKDLINHKNDPIYFMHKRIIFVSTTLSNSIEYWIDSIFTLNNSNLNVNINKFNEVFFKNSLKIGKFIDKSTNHNLSNVKHEFIHVTDYDKIPTLLKIIKEKQYLFDLIGNNKVAKNIAISVSEKLAIKNNQSSVIIFCNSINCARKIAHDINEAGFQCSVIHGEVPPFKRQEELFIFKSRRKKILVATDIIARGLDFPWVYYVINFDFPYSISDYIHRAGRTGRAGRSGICYSLYRNSDMKIIDEIKDCNSNKKALYIDKSIFSLKNKEEIIERVNKNNLKSIENQSYKELNNGKYLSENKKENISNEYETNVNNIYENHQHSNKTDFKSKKLKMILEKKSTYLQKKLKQNSAIGKFKEKKEKLVNEKIKIRKIKHKLLTAKRNFNQSKRRF